MSYADSVAVYSDMRATLAPVSQCYPFYRWADSVTLISDSMDAQADQKLFYLHMTYNKCYHWQDKNRKCHKLGIRHHIYVKSIILTQSFTTF